MKYLVEYNKYTVDDIKKGLNRSISKGDIELKTDLDNIIKNIKGFEINSIERFIYDEDDNFVAESTPEKLIGYIKDKKLDIDISKLEEYNKNKKELDKIQDNIVMIQNLGDKEDAKHLDTLYNREVELEKYPSLLKSEVLKVKSQILDKYPL